MRRVGKATTCMALRPYSAVHCRARDAAGMRTCPQAGRRVSHDRRACLPPARDRPDAQGEDTGDRPQPRGRGQWGPERGKAACCRAAGNSGAGGNEGRAHQGIPGMNECLACSRETAQREYGKRLSAAAFRRRREIRKESCGESASGRPNAFVPQSAVSSGRRPRPS